MPPCMTDHAHNLHAASVVITMWNTLLLAFQIRKNETNKKDTLTHDTIATTYYCYTPSQPASRCL